MSLPPCSHCRVSDTLSGMDIRRLDTRTEILLATETGLSTRTIRRYWEGREMLAVSERAIERAAIDHGLDWIIDQRAAMRVRREAA